MVGWEVEPNSVGVLGPNDLDWPPAHPGSGNAVGTTVPVPHDLGQ